MSNQNMTRQRALVDFCIHPMRRRVLPQACYALVHGAHAPLAVSRRAESQDILKAANQTRRLSTQEQHHVQTDRSQKQLSHVRRRRRLARWGERMMSATPSAPSALPRRRFIELMGGGVVLAAVPLAGCASGYPSAAIQAS
jgi:hypothetical protein